MLENKEFIRFSVVDSGKGIPCSMVEKVFEKFTQAEARQSGIARSTGLGLTFCKLAVEAHKGKIWLESKYIEEISDISGKSGTTFYFTLPKADNLTESMKEKREAQFAKDEQRRAQLTEQDKSLLFIFKKEIEALTIYDTGNIISTLEKIKSTAEKSGSENLILWLKNMEDAAYSFNEERFHQLLAWIIHK